MRLVRIIMIGIASVLLTACGAATAPAVPLFEGVTVPTRQPPPTLAPNTASVAAPTGAGTVFPATDGGEIRLNTTTNGSITPASYAVLYTYSGQAGQVVDISMTGRGGTLDTFLILIGPDGREVARNDDRSDTRSDAQIRAIDLPETGTFTVVASRWRSRYGEDIGDFTLEITESENTETLTPETRLTSYGVTQRGELNDNRVRDTYTFAGTAGDVVDITAFAAAESTDNLDTSITLTDSFGNILAANDDINPLDNFDAGIFDLRLPYNGYYTVIVSRYLGEDGDTSGGYEMIVERMGSDNTPLQYAYPDINQSVTLTDGNNGVLDYGFFVGDISLDTTTIPAQTILTYYLPPLDGELDRATLDLSICDTDGLGFDAIEEVNVYADTFTGRINSNTAYNPTSEARLLAALADCDTVDITALTKELYESDTRRIQFRLIPQTTTTEDGEDTVVFLAPRIRLQIAN